MAQTWIGGESKPTLKLDGKKVITKWLNITDENTKANDFYRAKLFGEGKTVEYSIDGLSNSHCKLTEWVNGEGYDISFDTDKQNTKTISLHTDELDVLFACLNHLKYFGE
jgi:cAMP phosphodiesterase